MSPEGGAAALMPGHSIALQWLDVVVVGVKVVEVVVIGVVVVSVWFGISLRNYGRCHTKDSNKLSIGFTYPDEI